MTDYSLADIRAATEGENRGGMFAGEGLWGFILIFFILAIAGNGFGGMGFGGNRGVTNADLTNSFNFNSVDNQLRSIGNGIAQSNFATSGEIRGLSDRVAECCCESRLGTAENRYAAEKNTCDIVNAIHSDGEATRALINSNTMQELRDRLEQSQRQTLAAQFQLSQQAQTADLVKEIKPCAIPAYLTCSPYTSNPPYGCGSNYGF